MFTHTLTAEQFNEIKAGNRITITFFHEGSEPGTDTAILIDPPAAEAAVRFKGLASLSETVLKPTVFKVEIKPGFFSEFTIQALNSETCKECDDIMGDLMPPKKVKPAGRGGIQAPDEYDFDDKEYLAKRHVRVTLRQAFVLTKGLVDFEIPGADLQAKSRSLRAALPPRVLTALESAILSLSSDPIKTADFS